MTADHATDLGHQISALRRAVDAMQPLVTLDPYSRALAGAAKALLNQWDDMQEVAAPAGQTRRVRIPVHWGPLTQSWALNAVIPADPGRAAVDVIARSPEPIVAVVIADLPVPRAHIEIKALKVEETTR